jgi:hypothetical protein
VCDICGRREYDTQALNQLSVLLSPAASRKVTKKSARLTRKPASKRKDARPSPRD